MCVCLCAVACCVLLSVFLSHFFLAKSVVCLSSNRSPLFCGFCGARKAQEAGKQRKMGKMLSKIFGNKEMRILMLGLDAAGKTSTFIFVSCFFSSFLTAVFIQRSCISSSLTSLSRPFPQSDSTSRQSCTRTSSSTFGYVWGFFGSVVKTVMEHRMSVARTRFALYGDTTTRARRALSLSLTRMTASASTRPSKSSTVSLTTVRCAMRCSLFSQTSRTCPKVKPLYFFFYDQCF